jgi:hypothetical protein
MEASKLTRLEARTRAIQGAGKLALIACCLSLGFVVVATAIPQRKTLEKLEAKLLLAKQREREVSAQRDYRTIELRALREDPAYLEIHARDRLDYCGEGERVLKFKRAR